MRSASLIGLAFICWACSQPLQPVTNIPPMGVPTEFFWTARSLDSSELTYSMDRNGVTALHTIFSFDNKHVFDQSIGKMAFRIVSLGDTIAIDSLGANSLFSLPQGYFFAKDTTIIISHDSLTYDTTQRFFDTTKNRWIYNIDSSNHPVRVDTVVQRPGVLNLLMHAQLTSGGSWYAGKVAGLGLGSGLEITGRVLDHMDTLYLPSLQNQPPASYGETYMIRYSHEGASDSSNFPLFWKVYYTRNKGPVLIEEYMDAKGSGYNSKPSLQSQAVLKNQ